MKTAKTKAALTTQQRYGALNRRFDSRAALLRRYGFAYRQACPGVGVFTRTRYMRETNIPAATLLHADNDVWRNELRLILR